LSRFSKTVTAFTSDDIQTVPGSTGAKETRADRDRACLILRCFKSIKTVFVPLRLMLGRYWSTIPQSGLPDMYTLKISLYRFSVDLPNV